MTLGDVSRRLLVHHVMKAKQPVTCVQLILYSIQYYVSHCIDPALKINILPASFSSKQTQFCIDDMANLTRLKISNLEESSMNHDTLRMAMPCNKCYLR